MVGKASRTRRRTGMRSSEGRRAEEAVLMQDFDHGFAVRHGPALHAIAERLGLDYVIVDCAETQDGRLLLFEVDSRGLIHFTDPVDVFPYKPIVMDRAFRAFPSMLTSRLPFTPTQDVTASASELAERVELPQEPRSPRP